MLRSEPACRSRGSTPRCGGARHSAAGEAGERAGVGAAIRDGWKEGLRRGRPYLALVSGDDQHEPTELIVALDAQTGKEAWRFNTIPNPGDFGHDTWLNDSWAINGNVGVWTQITVDEDLGLVYLPVETPTIDEYGGNRPGDNLFTDSGVTPSPLILTRAAHDLPSPSVPSIGIGPVPSIKFSLRLINHRDEPFKGRVVIGGPVSKATAPGGMPVTLAAKEARMVEVRREGDEYVLQDLGSANGTLYNGATVEGAVHLTAGGRIQIGQRVVHDTHDYGVLSFTDVIVKSSNVGAIKIGFKVGVGSVAVAALFILLVLLHYSTVLSRLTDDNVLLAQEVDGGRPIEHARAEFFRFLHEPFDEREAGFQREQVAMQVADDPQGGGGVEQVGAVDPDHARLHLGRDIRRHRGAFRPGSRAWSPARRPS